MEISLGALAVIICQSKKLKCLSIDAFLSVDRSASMQYTSKTFLFDSSYYSQYQMVKRHPYDDGVGIRFSAHQFIPLTQTVCSIAFAPANCFNNVQTFTIFCSIEQSKVHHQKNNFYLK